MFDPTVQLARQLAARSSRRHFFQFLGAGALGTGLTLTGAGVTLASAQSCATCTGGPFHPRHRGRSGRAAAAKHHDLCAGSGYGRARARGKPQQPPAAYSRDCRERVAGVAGVDRVGSLPGYGEGRHAVLHLVTGWDDQSGDAASGL